MVECYIFTKTEDIKFLSKTADSDEYFFSPYFVVNSHIRVNQPLNRSLTSSLMIWSKRHKKQTITYNVCLQNHCTKRYVLLCFDGCLID